VLMVFDPSYGLTMEEKLDTVRAAYTNTLAYRGLVEVKDLKEAGMRLAVNLAEGLHCIVGKGKVSRELNRSDSS
jgi:hypothetical protein